ncbi:MAG: VWA domain-containing protein, partial [Cellvibrionaceae bacterium]|nr:VWA domain-containing protein [Cellvibrionaceae bacterium]
MQKIYADFIHALRQQGLPISPAETLDALRVVELLGPKNREQLKQGMGLVLAKNVNDKLSYEHLFEQFFQFAETVEGDSAESQSVASEPYADQASKADEDGGEAGPSPQSELGQLLMSNRAGATEVAIAAAGDAEDIQNMQLFTQKPLYAFRMMNRMGNEALNQELSELDASNELADRQLATELRRAQAALQEQLRDYVEQQYLLYAQAKGEQLRENNLQAIKLTNVDYQYIEQMSRLVRKSAKRLASLHSRRRKTKKRGLLDVRKTIAANAAYDGILFHTRWKSTRIEKPRVMVICDVSGSVSRVARFLLLFLYSLQDVLPRTRSFVFSSDMAEVTDQFESLDIEQAVAEVMAKWANQSTSYDKALADFSELALKDVDQKTTVIMLGDARNNNGPGRPDIWQKVYR